MKLNQNKFKIFSHTADIGLDIFGNNPRELFVNAAYGLMSLMAEPRAVHNPRQRKVEIKSNDWESLLAEWLNELIFLATVKRFFYSGIRVVKLIPFHLKADLKGVTASPRKSYIQREIKAVTYHQLKVRKIRGVYRARVIFDI